MAPVTLGAFKKYSSGVRNLRPQLLANSKNVREVSMSSELKLTVQTYSGRCPSRRLAGPPSARQRNCVAHLQ